MDITTNIHVILRAPLHQRIYEISNLVEQVPFKDLQTCYPIIVNSIFGNGGASEDWGLRNTTEHNAGYDLLYNFLKPDGPLFRICYKLLGDPQLKYVFPTRLLPMEVFQMLESGRVAQFYLDILNLDPHTRQVISLNLNPFDYYIFHFSVFLHTAPANKGIWDTWNTLYYTLCCTYLLHFLPSDPTTPVTPHIAYFTGKTPPVTPMQTSTRHSHFPSILLSQELSSPAVASTTSQLHPRGEIWRSETVLQVFIDVWLTTSSNQVGPEQQMNQQGTQATPSTYPLHEHVRISRALIKQCHSFTQGGWCDPGPLGELRRAAPLAIQARALPHIRHLMHSWPLDASFRLVLELWFSYIQPWRYAGLKDERNSQQERLDTSTEDSSGRSQQIDSSYLPFITENILAYTEIFQLVLPRFLRLDLTVPKNAIMLFRFAKVFSQSNLVQLLTDVEKSITENGNELNLLNNQYSHHASHSYQQLNTSQTNTSGFLDRTSNSMDTRLPMNTSELGVSYETLWMQSVHHPTVLHQHFGAGYKSSLMMECAGTQQYQAVFLGSARPMVRELLVYSKQALAQVEAIIKARNEQRKQKRKGFFGSISYWLMGDCDSADEIPLEELEKVPTYINFALTQLAQIFNWEVTEQEIQSPCTSFSSSNTSESHIRRRHSPNIALSPKDSQERAKNIKYMGNPDLQPVRTNENGFLVHILNQISSKINEMYGAEMNQFYHREDYLGVLSREILEPPCEIKSFCKSGPSYGFLVSSNLPPRLCLRPLASHAFLFWFVILLVALYFFDCRYSLYLSMIVATWFFVILCKATIKYLSGNRSNFRDNRGFVESTHDVSSFYNRENSG